MLCILVPDRKRSFSGVSYRANSSEKGAIVLVHPDAVKAVQAHRYQVQTPLVPGRRRPSVVDRLRELFQPKPQRGLVLREIRRAGAAV